jgi:hypothetical protein
VPARGSLASCLDAMGIHPYILAISADWPSRVSPTTAPRYSISSTCRACPAASVEALAQVDGDDDGVAFKHSCYMFGSKGGCGSDHQRKKDVPWIEEGANGISQSSPSRAPQRG